MKHSKSALFLMELIITILFFSLASTVCIQLFTKSHLLSKQTVNENHAVIQAQNLAECFLATEGDMVQIQNLFPNSILNAENTITLLFDENWAECDSSTALYCVNLVSHPVEDGLITGEITVSSYGSDHAETIYTITVKHHIPERRNSLGN